MFTHNLLQRSMVAAIMDGKVGWENGRAGLCAGISFEIPLFQVALMEASLAALQMVREKPSHAQLAIGESISEALTCTRGVYL